MFRSVSYLPFFCTFCTKLPNSCFFLTFELLNYVDFFRVHLLNCNMKRVLIITYYWPPSGGSGVQRWVKFSKYLPGFEWQPVIYTPENPELIATDRTLELEVPSEAEIIKRPILEPYNIYKSIFGKGNDGGKKINQVNPINAGKKSLLQKAAMFVRGNFFIPDPRCYWIGPSVRFLKKYLKAHPVDIIVSTGPPHSMHLIAEKLSREVNIPWVADFRDPWTKMFYFKHLHLSPWAERRHRKLEKKVLDRASVIVSVSPLVQKEFQEMTSTEVELITNGYDESDFKDAIVEADGYFNIVHTGLFASDGNPETLWKALGDKCRKDSMFSRKLRIRLVGKTDAEILSSITENGLENNLINNGYQPHGVAVKEQKNATVLILPLRKEPEYKAVVPGKVFEYLAAGHPILGIGQTDGAMAMILDSTRTGKVFQWDDYDSTSAFIELQWQRFIQDETGTPPADISGFSRRALTSRMVDLFEKLLTKRP